MKKIFLIIGLASAVTFGFKSHEGGVYKSNTGNINFYSHTSVEDISADNHKVKTALTQQAAKCNTVFWLKILSLKKHLCKSISTKTTWKAPSIQNLLLMEQ